VGFSGPLSDRVEIRELYETYVDAVAMNDAELWASTWVDDCVWHIAGQTTEGNDKTGNRRLMWCRCRMPWASSWLSVQK
jgi:ketosteroid isomerase-like protein